MDRQNVNQRQQFHQQMANLHQQMATPRSKTEIEGKKNLNQCHINQVPETNFGLNDIYLFQEEDSYE